MLRVIVLIVSIFVLSVEAQEKFREPTKDELAEQLKLVDQALLQSKKLQTSDALKNILKKQKESMSSAQSGPISDYNLPEYVDEARQKRYLESVFNGGFAESPDTEMPNRDKPIALISLAMPTEELRNLLRELKRVGSGAVIRGLVNNDFKTTVERVREIADGDDSLAGISVDPTIFERFSVDRVPAFIMPLEPIEGCSPSGCAVPEHVKAVGSITLDYFLRMIVRRSQVSLERNIAEQWLTEMEVQ